MPLHRILPPSARDGIDALVCGYAARLRNSKRLVMLQAHIDDSGSEGTTPIYALGGYVLPAEAWADFSDEWEHTLHSGKPIEYFKMREARSYSEQFLGWTRGERDDKISQLSEVIPRHALMGLVCYIEWDEYRQFMANSVLPEQFDTPYFFLFYGIIESMLLAGFHFGNPESTDFVFDEQGKIGLEAVQWYGAFKSRAAEHLQPMLGSSPIFRDDKKVLPLQAADMLAWHQRRDIYQPESINEIEVATKERISRGIALWRKLDIGYMEWAAERYIVGFSQ